MPTFKKLAKLNDIKKMNGIITYIKSFHYLPFAKGGVVLQSKETDFISKLKELTERDFDMFRHYGEYYYKGSRKYERILNGQKFKLRKIQKSKSGPLLGTVIYGEITQLSENRLDFKYNIRPSNLSIFFMLVMLVLCTISFYFSFEESISFESFKGELFVLFSNLVGWIWFDQSIKEDKVFI